MIDSPRSTMADTDREQGDREQVDRGGVDWEGIDWEGVERLAVELATLAGAEITVALSQAMSVRYKGAAGSFRDPVSEIDQRVEMLIRARLVAQFPAHDVLGEEMERRADVAHDVVWAVDPIDGTSNFINGFPLFCASIGVLHRGRPMVGAIWCATSHLLRSGVYHARRHGPLCFDGEPVVRERNPLVRRRLGGEPEATASRAPWDIRKTGSAAIECAFVAAGLLQVARFTGPNVWDVAGGIALALAAGKAVRVARAGRWESFEGFDDGVAGGGNAGCRVARDWRRPIVIGEPEAVALACEIYRP